MIFILYLLLIIAIIVAVKLILDCITKNAKDNYGFLQSQREDSDTVQSFSDKAYTAMGGNSFIDSMVSISMLNQDPDAHSKKD